MTLEAKVKSLLEVHGVCRSQELSDWKGDTDLPKPLADFYRNVGPVDIIVPGYGNPTTIYSLANLWESQVGYGLDGMTTFNPAV